MSDDRDWETDHRLYYYTCYLSLMFWMLVLAIWSPAAARSSADYAGFATFVFAAAVMGGWGVWMGDVVYDAFESVTWRVSWNYLRSMRELREFGRRGVR